MIKNIVLIYSTLQTGDVSHVKALAEVWEKEPYKTQVSIIHQDVSKNEQEILNDTEDTIYIAVGEMGLEALKTLKEENNKIKTGSSLHQYFNIIGDIKLDFIALPEAVVDTNAKRVVIDRIPSKQLTLGVPTKNPTSEQLKTAYENWQTENKPSLTGKYIIVMLPGDAPDAKGKQNLFTQKSADELLENLKQFFNTHKFIIQNGPRTNKFKEDGKTIACSHEYPKGGDPKQAEDEITKYFVSALKNSRVDYKLFNFASEVEELDELDDKGSKKRKVTGNSVFNQTLYLLTANPDNKFILPGESVSMLSQIPLYASPDQVIIFNPSSMNDQHKAIAAVVINKGHAAYFDDKGNCIYPEKPAKLELDDATNVANAIMQIGIQKQMSM